MEHYNKEKKKMQRERELANDHTLGYSRLASPSGGGDTLFSGIIEKTAAVTRLTASGAERMLTIGNPFGGEAQCGDSIAVDGVCLTVTERSAQHLSFFVSAETVKKTRAAAYKPGQIVNLERALVFGGRLDGHLVTGHVDTVGRIAAVRKIGDGVEVSIHVPPHFKMLLVEQGSLAVNGVSLTVARLEGDRVTVSLVPETLKRTSFESALSVGETVNLEFDIIGKYVLRLLGPRTKDESLRALLAQWEKKEERS